MFPGALVHARCWGCQDEDSPFTQNTQNWNALLKCYNDPKNPTIFSKSECGEVRFQTTSLSALNLLLPDTPHAIGPDRHCPPRKSNTE